MDTPFEKLHKPLQDCNTVVLITQGENTARQARPMAVAHVDENCAEIKECEQQCQVILTHGAGWPPSSR